MSVFLLKYFKKQKTYLVASVMHYDETMIRSVASLIHSDEGLKYYEGSLIHSVEPVTHSVEPVIHSIEPLIHSVEADASILLQINKLRNGSKTKIPSLIAKEF